MITLSKIKNIFLPNIFETVLYVIVIIIVVFLANFGEITGNIIKTGEVQNNEVNQIFSSINFSPDSLLLKFGVESEKGALISTLLFWSIIGVVAYGVMSVFISNFNSIMEIKKEADNYIFPDQSSRQKYLALFILEIIARISSLFMLAVFGLILISSITPVVMLGMKYSQDLTLQNFALSLVKNILILAVCLHLLDAFYRIAFNHPRNDEE